jgi:hypothetical protein
MRFFNAAANPRIGAACMAHDILPEPNDFYFKLQNTEKENVRAARLEPAIAYCEKVLAELPATSYHAAKGQSFLGHSDEAAGWLTAFYRQESESTRIKAIYVELTRFEINTDVWDAHAFAYDFFGDPVDAGWLCGWKSHTERALVLDDLARVRDAYREKYHEEATPNEQKVADVVSMLVTLRFQELIRAATAQARAAGGIPENVPVLAAVHESDMVMVCYGRTKPRITPMQPARPGHIPVPNDGKKRVYLIESGWDEFRNSLPWDLLHFESVHEDMRLDLVLHQTRPLLETWKPLNMFLDRRKWRCDLMAAGVGHHWAVGKKAHNSFASLLGETVEFLPVNCDHLKPCWIIHPLHYVDLAPAAEHNAKGTANMTVVRKWAFRPEDLAGLHLFGLHQAPRSRSRQEGIGFCGNLCSDQFRRTVEVNDLFGIVFQEVFAYEPTLSREI